MPEMLYPGVFPTEVSYDGYIAAQGTSTWGVLGVFEKGPIGVATLVTSLEDAKNKFGSYVAGYSALHALKSFFENGGTRAYVVRVVSYAAGAKTSVGASVTLKDRAGTPLDTLKVTAASDGVWGNALNVKVEASDAYPTTGVTLSVRQGTTVLEVFKDVLIGTASQAADDYIVKRVNGKSALITVTDLLSATASPNNLPALSAAGGDALIGGDNGLTSLATLDFVGDATRGAPGLTALDGVPVNFIAVPGEAKTANASVLNTALVTYCAARKDAFAILEAPQGLGTQGLVDFRSATGAFSGGSNSSIDNSYGALYGPWQRATHPVTGAEVLIPVSGIVAGIYARNDQQGAVWTAPAGLNRATVVGVNGPEVEFKAADLAVLYPKQINVIARMNGVLVIDGQKTLQKRGSATDRVNVRRMLCDIEARVTTETNFLVYEPIRPATMASFVRLVEPLLREIKAGGGIDAFRVVCDTKLNTADTIAQNILKARVEVVPTKTAEFIPVEFAIAPTGTTFSA